MESSQDSALKRFECDLKEDFELLELQDLTDPLKFYHKALRCKYFRRLQRRFDGQFHEQTQNCNGFQVVLGLEDHYQFYQDFYIDRRAFHRLVDCELFGEMRRRLGQNRSTSRLTPQSEIEAALKEFKLLVEVLMDLYERGQLYSFLDAENEQRFAKFDVNCASMTDIIVPFFLSKVFGGLNTLSSRLLQQVLIKVLTNIVAINAGAVALFVPELDCLFNSQSFLGKNIERLIFSRLFKRQRAQILFIFVRLNGLLREHIEELESAYASFFERPEPLDLGSFRACYEVLNAKYEELNGDFKFPAKAGSVLDLKELCKATNFKLDREFATLRNEQEAVAFDEMCAFEGECVSELSDEQYWARTILMEQAKIEESPACFIKAEAEFLELDVSEVLEEVEPAELSEENKDFGVLCFEATDEIREHEQFKENQDWGRFDCEFTTLGKMLTDRKSVV